MTSTFIPEKVLFITEANYDDENKYLTVVKALFVNVPTDYCYSDSKIEILDRKTLLLRINDGYKVFTLRLTQYKEIEPAMVVRHEYYDETYLATGMFYTRDNLGMLPPVTQTETPV